MARSKIILTACSIVALAVFAVTAQTNRQRIAAAGPAASAQLCLLNGSYRINIAESDKLYSVVKDATSTVPFGEQQRFFLDLSTRLTPPDMLAIECRGSRVTVGSSRAPRITYLADGKMRRERTPAGTFVNSKVELTRDSLTFLSSGKSDDSVNVAFDSLGAGRRLRVTRQLHAEQLTDPILIQTFYDKISDSVDWDIYDGKLVARQMPSGSARPQPRPAIGLGPGGAGSGRSAAEDALDDWLEATNGRDIDGQMRHYMSELRAYYLARNAPRNLVRAEKNKVFSGVRSVDIRAREPEIIFQEAGQVAVMRFVKEYRITGRSGAKSGAVVQELRWRRTPQGWRIFSERDVRVLR
jgi:ketosteroid isomerase-like protein